MCRCQGSANTIKKLTLLLVFLRFFCSIYVALRTVLPLLPRHHLARRSSISGAEPYLSSTAVDKRPHLKSAQRFTIWLSSIDILAACVLLWEVGKISSNLMNNADK